MNTQIPALGLSFSKRLLFLLVQDEFSILRGGNLLWGLSLPNSPLLLRFSQNVRRCHIQGFSDSDSGPRLSDVFVFYGHFPSKRHPGYHGPCRKPEASNRSDSENTHKNLSSLGLNWNPANSLRMVSISLVWFGSLRQLPTSHFVAHKEKLEALEERFSLCQTGTEDTTEKLPPCLGCSELGYTLPRSLCPNRAFNLSKGESFSAVKCRQFSYTWVLEGGRVTEWLDLVCIVPMDTHVYHTHFNIVSQTFGAPIQLSVLQNEIDQGKETCPRT